MSTSQKWITPQEYAKRVNKSRQQVYLDIRFGKVKSRKVKKTVYRIEVLEPVDK